MNGKIHAKNLYDKPKWVLMSVFNKKIPVKWTLFYFTIDLQNHLVKDRRLLIQLSPFPSFYLSGRCNANVHEKLGSRIVKLVTFFGVTGHSIK